MFPELVDALKTHIKNNIPKDSLRIDTIKAGYSNGEFEAAYATAAQMVAAETPVVGAAPVVGYASAETATDLTNAPSPEILVTPTQDNFSAIPSTTTPVDVQPSSVPPPTAQVPLDTTVVPISTESQNTPVRSKKPFVLVAIIATIVFLLVGTVMAAWTGFLPVPNFLGNMLGSGPYSTATPLQDIATGISDITSADFTVALQIEDEPLDSDVYLMPEEFVKEVGNPAMMLSLLPTDFAIDASLSGQFDKTETLSDTSLHIKGSYETPDFSAFVDVESILSKENGLYVRVNRMPSLFMLDLSAVRGTWVHLIEEPLQDMASTYLGDEVADKEKRMEQLELFIAQADKHHVFEIVGAPQREKLNNKTAYKYTFILNQDTLKDFFEDSIKVFDDKFGEGQHFLSTLTEEQIAIFSNEEFIKYANAHTQYHVWARGDGVPMQLEIETRTAVDDDAKANLFGSSMTEDERKQNALTSFSYYNDLYLRQNNNSFTGFCARQISSYQVVYQDWDIMCGETSKGYAVAIDLDYGSYCVDSSGYIGYGTVDSALSTKCTKQPDPVIPPKPEAAAERQVRSSLKLTFNSINEPVSIPIPEDAMSHDEAVKKVPALDMFGQMQRARESGSDASQKSRLSSARADAEIYYTESNSYAGFCDSPSAPENAVCGDKAQSWFAYSSLTNGQIFCVDATGYSGELASISTKEIETRFTCLEE